jgi:hypothetical protein
VAHVVSDRQGEARGFLLSGYFSVERNERQDMNTEGERRSKREKSGRDERKRKSQ